MTENQIRAAAWAAEAEASLNVVRDMVAGRGGTCTPQMALQIAAVEAQLASFWQAQPDVGDRALVVAS